MTAHSRAIKEMSPNLNRLETMLVECEEQSPNCCLDCPPESLYKCMIWWDTRVAGSGKNHGKHGNSGMLNLDLEPEQLTRFEAEFKAFSRLHAV